MLVGLFFVAHQTGLIPKPLKKKIKWYWIAENDNNQIILNVFLWSFRNHSSLQNNIRSNITNFPVAGMFIERYGFIYCF